jgi:hypothetical protein
MADIPIDAIPRRVQFTGNTGLGPFAFTFNILAAADIAVYKNATLLTITTDYTVSLNANGTGSVTLTGAGSGTALVAADYLTIIGDLPLARTTDFTTAGDLLASALNDQLDASVVMTQQISERVDRALRQDPNDVDGDMTIPEKADRLGKLLQFNTTTGNPEAVSPTSIVGSGAFNVYDFAGDGATVAFTLGTDPGVENNTQVYINGVYQQKNTYTVSGTTLTFSVAPANLSSIEVMVITAQPINTANAASVSFTQVGSTDTRTVQAKLQETVSVKDFGAVGDGVTDDTAAIQAAIDYGAVLGKKILFPASTYSITSLTLPQSDGGIYLCGEARSGHYGLSLIDYKGAVLVSTLTSGNIISCDGGVSVINRAIILENFSLKVATSGYAISLVGAPEVTTIRNLTIRNTNTSGSGINLEKCYSGVSLEKLLIHTDSPNTGFGVRIESIVVAGGIKIDGCQINGFGRNLNAVSGIYQILVVSSAFEGGGYGAYIDGECNVEFHKCHFEFNNENAIFLNNSVSTLVKGCSFYSNANSVSAGTQSEIDIGGSPTYNLNTVIDGNYCFGLKDNTSFVRISAPAFSGGIISNNLIKAIGINTTGIFSASATPSQWGIENNSPISLTTFSSHTTGWRKFISWNDANLYFKAGPRFDGTINLLGVDTLASDAVSSYLKASGNLYFQPGGSTQAVLSSTGNLDITGQLEIGAGNVIWSSGAGTPEGSITAPVGSMFSRTDGGSGTSLYVKESGAGNTGWVAK